MTELNQWLRFHAPSAGGPGSVPGQGTRSHMPQRKLKIPRVSTKTQHRQINIFKKNKSILSPPLLVFNLLSQHCSQLFSPGVRPFLPGRNICFFFFKQSLGPSLFTWFSGRMPGTACSVGNLITQMHKLELVGTLYLLASLKM